MFFFKHKTVDVMRISDLCTDLCSSDLLTIDYDGTLDELVISHEFFHHVSNRLVANGSGLGNTQGGGMGEGWSDVDSLLLAVRPNDVGAGSSVYPNDHYQGAYPTGFYVIPRDRKSGV